jgi:hypothetical protein
MSNPAGKEQRNVSSSQIERIQLKGEAVMNKVSRVIKHHDDHHDASQEIDRVDSLT